MSYLNETDEKFERYLKQFRPLAPEPLPRKRQIRMTSHRFVFAVGVAAAAAFLVVISSAVYLRRNPIHSPVGAGPTKDAERSIDSQPLTIGRANALLTRSPSFKTAIDQLAFRSPAIQTPDDSHSALAALSKEKTKL
jgi:hypothetical protein